MQNLHSQIEILTKENEQLKPKAKLEKEINEMEEVNNGIKVIHPKLYKVAVQCLIMKCLRNWCRYQLKNPLLVRTSRYLLMFLLKLSKYRAVGRSENPEGQVVIWWA
jgi:hypothetical protein